MSGTKNTATFSESKSPKPAGFKITREQEDAILRYGMTAQQLLHNQFSLRNRLEVIDRAYMRETDRTDAQIMAKTANRLGNPTKFQNISVPVVMPQVQAALGYLTNVFLTGYPIFDVNSDPSSQDAAMQLSTIIAENSITAGWARQFLMFFRDGLKYNMHGMECIWDQKTQATVITDPTTATAKPKTVLWNGNVLRRMDMYNTFFDPRVAPADVHSKGEYAGYVEILSRIALKQMINDLFNEVDKVTAIRAFETSFGQGSTASGATPFSYYQPLINPDPLMPAANQQTFDWMAWASAGLNTTTGIQYKNVYTKTTLYARLIPSDFNFAVPGANTPQVWKFIIINGSVVLTAERLSNAHNFIPIFFGQPLEDGGSLCFQTKSFATNVQPMQEVASAMMNGYVASKRRLVGDRVLYDPLRVTEKDINSTDPAAKIPVRPAAYGKPVGEAVFPFPFRDDNTQSFIQGAKMVTDYANLINGQNPAQQGQFVKGNKTQHEYEDVMGHGNATNQMMAIATETQVLTPLKEVLKLNALQFQGPAILFNPNTQQNVNIDPVTLRTQAVQFKVSDGLIPTDKIMGGDEFMTAIQVIGSSPQIGAGYNLAPLFTYMMKLRGADLSAFEKSPEQVQYEQQMGAWQQAAAQAAKTGAAFSTPMPQPPPQQPPKQPASIAALNATQGKLPSPPAPSGPQQSGQPTGAPNQQQVGGTNG